MFGVAVFCVHRTGAGASEENRTTEDILSTIIQADTMV